MRVNVLPALAALCLCLPPNSEASWDQWWTYTGISGPKFWGLLNMNWSMCDKGNRQSPINVRVDRMVFDPHLRHIHVARHRVSGRLMNKGQSVVLRLDDTDSKSSVNISGGPLVYKYRFYELYVHFGAEDQKGSEHYINGRAFPGEVQLYGFNSDLYSSMEEAQLSSNGIVAVSLMLQLDDRGNDEFRLISKGFGKILYRGDETPIPHISLGALLPPTPHYHTYEGSTTHPGCWETTTWVIINKPIYITTMEMASLRQLFQGDRTLPKAFMANNFRLTQPLHHRTVRTNVDFTPSPCSKSMGGNRHYSAKQWPVL